MQQSLSRINHKVKRFADDPNDVTWNPDMTQDENSSYYEDIDQSVNAVIAMTATRHNGEPQTIEEALSGSEKILEGSY
ncbi:unnamed protein product [Colias eurytheme]|nr:unnamed protein product [Colias eurytheme]